MSNSMRKPGPAAAVKVGGRCQWQQLVTVAVAVAQAASVAVTVTVTVTVVGVAVTVAGPEVEGSDPSRGCSRRPWR